MDWSLKISVIKPAEVDEDTANSLLRSFLQGNSRTLKGGFATMMNNQKGVTVTETKKIGPVTVKHSGPSAWSRTQEKELIYLFRKGTSLDARAFRICKATLHKNKNRIA